MVSIYKEAEKMEGEEEEEGKEENEEKKVTNDQVRMGLKCVWSRVCHRNKKNLSSSYEL